MRGEDRSLLIHAIVWPAVGAIILLVLFVVLLYYVSSLWNTGLLTGYSPLQVGFFKRKSPAEDEEPEPLPIASSKEVEAEITGL